MAYNGWNANFWTPQPAAPSGQPASAANFVPHLQAPDEQMVGVMAAIKSEGDLEDDLRPQFSGLLAMQNGMGEYAYSPPPLPELDAVAASISDLDTPAVLAAVAAQAAQEFALSDHHLHPEGKEVGHLGQGQQQKVEKEEGGGDGGEKDEGREDDKQDDEGGGEDDGAKKGKKRKAGGGVKKDEEGNEEDEGGGGGAENEDDGTGKKKKRKKKQTAASAAANKAKFLRKNIREILGEDQLEAETVAAQREEMERKQRLLEVQMRLQQHHQQQQQQQHHQQQQQQRTEAQAPVIATRIVAGPVRGQVPGQVVGSTMSQVAERTPSGGVSAGVSGGVSGGSAAVTATQVGATVQAAASAAPSSRKTDSDIIVLGSSSSSGSTSSSTSSELSSDEGVRKMVKPRKRMVRPKVTKINGRPLPGSVISLGSSCSSSVTSSSSTESSTSSSSSGEKDDDDSVVVVNSDGTDESDEDVVVKGRDLSNSGSHVDDTFNVPDAQGRVLVNVGHPPEEADIFLAPQLARAIKPHQIGGIRFLYDNVIESLTQFKKSHGFGCILAHCMGLGKTFQMVSFVDVFLRQTGARTVLIVVPINTIQNWLAEFNMWAPDEHDVPQEAVMMGHVRPRNFPVYVLGDGHKAMTARAKVVGEWMSQGGVLLIGYEMYRLLASKKAGVKNRRRKARETVEADERVKELQEDILQSLQKPDLVVCDEGHRIKNCHANVAQALKSIKTRRRVVLTGYPLQNNLIEYWCMVDFVRPNFLGTRAEFCNMFERPIQNGQCVDSTPEDIRYMRFRAHVLHSLLEGFVQRRGHSVLRCTLPKKEEFVLLIRMTSIQRRLYQAFMQELQSRNLITNPIRAFAICCKIWNHPDVLYHCVRNLQARDDLDLDLEEVGTPNPNAKVPPGGATTNLTPQPRRRGAPRGGGANATKALPFQQLAGVNLPKACPINIQPKLAAVTPTVAAVTPMIAPTQTNVPGVAVPPAIIPPPSLLPSSLPPPSLPIPSPPSTAQMPLSAEQQQTQQNVVAEPEVVTTNHRDKNEAISYDWAPPILRDYQPGMLENGPKVALTFAIVEEALKVGDRALVFSQSLFTLNLVEEFLSRSYVAGTGDPWTRNRNYFRLDGSTSSTDREKMINDFNRNPGVFLFLISTRAGSLGINLVGANRVIVLDASWNPCHDTQAVCRVYRYGQIKPCYVYRLVADNSLEKRIYDRQINKQGMSDRIVDELSPDVTLTIKDMYSLMSPNEPDPPLKDLAPLADSFENRDHVLQHVCRHLGGLLTKEPFEHESLLVDRKELKLTKSEKRQAKQAYEMDKKASVTYARPGILGVGANPRFGLPYPNQLRRHEPFVRGGRPIANVRPFKTTPTQATTWNLSRFNGTSNDALSRHGISVHPVTVAKELTIPTPSPAGPIQIREGQRVFIIKSPQGIYLRCPDGKMISVRMPAQQVDALNSSSASSAVSTSAAGNRAAATVIAGARAPAVTSVTSATVTVTTASEVSLSPVAAATGPTLQSKPSIPMIVNSPKPIAPKPAIGPSAAAAVLRPLGHTEDGLRADHRVTEVIDVSDDEGGATGGSSGDDEDDDDMMVTATSFPQSWRNPSSTHHHHAPHQNLRPIPLPPMPTTTPPPVRQPAGPNPRNPTPLPGNMCPRNLGLLAGGRITWSDVPQSSSGTTASSTGSAAGTPTAPAVHRAWETVTSPTLPNAANAGGNSLGSITQLLSSRSPAVAVGGAQGQGPNLGTPMSAPPSLAPAGLPVSAMDYLNKTLSAPCTSSLGRGPPSLHQSHHPFSPEHLAFLDSLPDILARHGPNVAGSGEGPGAAAGGAALTVGDQVTGGAGSPGAAPLRHWGLGSGGGGAGSVGSSRGQTSPNAAGTSPVLGDPVNAHELGYLFPHIVDAVTRGATTSTAK